MAQTLEGNRHASAKMRQWLYTLASRFWFALELKPGLFGVRLDLKKLFQRH
jgi:hypothetical protein